MEEFFSSKDSNMILESEFSLVGIAGTKGNNQTPLLQGDQAYF